MYRPEKIIIENIISHEKTSYTFRKGLPVVVIGENRDDPSQKGNGAGKSAIMEGIAIALTGNSVRNATMKRLVRRGSDYGTVDLTLINSMYGTTLRIWRKIYSGSKSSEVKIWEDGKEVVVSDVNEYNKLIFRLLDLDKDDFFSFFLITKEYYKPFLSVGDTVKKQIINRFSGADTVDGVTPAIDSNVTEKKQVLNAVQLQISANQGKQEVISQQIQTEEAKFSEEALTELLKQYETELDALVQRAEEIGTMLDSANDRLTEARNDEVSFIAEDFDIDIAFNKRDAEQSSKKIDTKRAELNGVKAKFDEEVKEIKLKDEQLKKDLETLRNDLKEGQLTKAHLEGQLAGTIECPSCQHKFLLADKDANVEELSENLQMVLDIISATEQTIKEKTAVQELIEKEKQSVNSRIVAEQVKIKTAIDELIQENQKYATELQQLQNKKSKQMDDIRKLQENVAAEERNVRDLTVSQDDAVKAAEEIAIEMENISQRKSQTLDQLQEQLLDYVDEGTELNEKFSRVSEELQAVEEWYTNFKNFKSFLANQSIKNIEDYTNLYLQKMGSNLSIRIDGYKAQSTGKIKEQIATTICRDGFPEDEYGTYSGGERGRIDVCVILAIQSLINLNSRSGGLDLLCADEIFDSIDSLGLQCIVEGLLETKRTVMFVSQVEVNALKEHQLTIRKQNKISTIV